MHKDNFFVYHCIIMPLISSFLLVLFCHTLLLHCVFLRFASQSLISPLIFFYKNKRLPEKVRLLSFHIFRCDLPFGFIFYFYFHFHVLRCKNPKTVFTRFPMLGGNSVKTFPPKDIWGLAAEEDRARRNNHAKPQKVVVEKVAIVPEIVGTMLRKFTPKSKSQPNQFKYTSSQRQFA